MEPKRELQLLRVPVCACFVKYGEKIELLLANETYQYMFHIIRQLLAPPQYINIPTAGDPMWWAELTHMLGRLTTVCWFQNSDKGVKQDLSVFPAPQLCMDTLCVAPKIADRIHKFIGATSHVRMVVALWIFEPLVNMVDHAAEGEHREPAILQLRPREPVVRLLVVLELERVEAKVARRAAILKHVHHRVLALVGRDLDPRHEKDNLQHRLRGDRRDGRL